MLHNTRGSAFGGKANHKRSVIENTHTSGSIAAQFGAKRSALPSFAAFWRQKAANSLGNGKNVSKSLFGAKKRAETENLA